MVDDQYQQYRRCLLDQLRQNQSVSVAPMFYDDFEIVSLALNVGWIPVKDISERLRDHLEIARLVIEKDAYSFQYLSERLKDDTEFARFAIEKHSYLFQYLSERLKDDTEFARFAIEKHAYLFQYLSERLKDDTEFARFAIEKDAHNFQDISERLKNDRQCILTAANRNPCFLINHPQFQDDDEIYLISKDKLMQYTREINPKFTESFDPFFLFAYLPVLPSRLDEDDDLYTLIESKFIEYIEFIPFKRLSDIVSSDRPCLSVSNRLLHNHKVYQIIKEDYLYDINQQKYIWEDHRYEKLPIWKKFLSDLEILKATFFYNINILNHVSSELKSSKEFIKMVIEINPFALKFAAQELKDDYNLVCLAVEIDPFTLQFASERLQLDENLLLKFVLHPNVQKKYHEIINTSGFIYETEYYVKSKIDSIFKSKNLNLQTKLIANHPKFLKYLNHSYLKNQEILFKIIDLNIDIFQYFSDQIKKKYVKSKCDLIMKETYIDKYLTIFKNNPSCLNDLDQALKDDEIFIFKMITFGINILPYASHRLQKDKTLMLKAIRSNMKINESNFDEELQCEFYKNSNRLIKFPLIENHKRENYLIDLKTKEHIDYFPSQYKDDIVFVKEAILININVFRHLSDHLKIQMIPMIFENLSLLINQLKRSKSQLNWWFNFLSSYPEYYQRLLDDEKIKQLLDDEKFLIDQEYSTDYEDHIIQHISKRLKANADFIIHMVHKYRFNNHHFFSLIDADLKDNEKFIENLIKNNLILFQHASNRLKDDEKFIFKIIQRSEKYTMIMPHISDRLKDHNRFMARLIKEKGYNAEYASDRIKSLLDPKVKSRINPKDESN